jgi:hypothetical protein
MSSPCVGFNQCGWVAGCFSAILAFATTLSFFIFVAFNAISAAIAGAWNLPIKADPLTYLGLLPTVLVPSLGAWFGSSILNDFIAWILKALLCNDIESIQNETECENVNFVFKTALSAFYLMFFLAMLALFIAAIIFFEVRFGTAVF